MHNDCCSLWDAWHVWELPLLMHTVSLYDSTCDDINIFDRSVIVYGYLVFDDALWWKIDYTHLYPVV